MPRILIVQGSLNPESVTAAMLRDLAGKLTKLGGQVDFLDLREKNLPFYVPGKKDDVPKLDEIRDLVQAADVLVLGTPDYHGGPCGTLKNFLDYFWREFCGKLFGYVCASHEKGLTPMDQLRTHVRQCYGWSLPYGVSGVEDDEVEAEGRIVSERLDKRISMMANDLMNYGELIRQQRERDLAGDHPTFVGILRRK